MHRIIVRRERWRIKGRGPRLGSYTQSECGPQAAIETTKQTKTAGAPRAEMAYLLNLDLNYGSELDSAGIVTSIDSLVLQ